MFTFASSSLLAGTGRSVLSGVGPEAPSMLLSILMTQVEADLLRFEAFRSSTTRN